MKAIKGSLGLLVLALFAVAGTARAAEAAPAWGLSLDGGWATYAMGDLNDQLSGSPMGSINGGGDISLSVDWKPMPALQVAIDVEDLMAYSSGSVAGFDENLGASAMWIGPAGYWVMPFADQWNLRLGVGLGYLALVSDQMTMSGHGQYMAVDFTGSGFGARGIVAADYYFTPHVSLGLELGYRYAVISSFQADGTTATKNDGSDMKLDYSGLHDKLALSYWF